MDTGTFTVRRYMTSLPYTVGRAQPLNVARRLMKQHGVRHLPVMEMGKMVGLLSERELSLIEGLPGVDAVAVKVEEAMVPGVYVVSPDAPLSAIVDEMAEAKVGSAVVMEHDRVVGVFTTTDALRALGDLLRRASA